MAAVPGSYVITLPAGTVLLSANGREHWRARHAITRDLRDLACLLARNKHIPKLEKVKIKATYHPPDRRRNDADNCHPSVKALVDGLVDAGVLDDDDNSHVLSTEIVPGAIVKKGQLIIEVIDCGGSA